ncbi:MAG: bifunctional folylpolyglutamate synthase/dihydrofolate synthase [Limisphaerales bacterium]
MSYSEAIQFLYGLNLFGANFGLETTRQLAARVGNPQEKLRFVHVAGTNGKGSTCAMLESIYRAAGLRVGLFTSPHLVSFRERIQVNRERIPENDVVRLVEDLRRTGVMPVSNQIPAQAEPEIRNERNPGPTFFEFVTVMALKFFAEQRCDLVIWETGLGGRLDATNIVTPLASVITNIAFDHQQWLGETLDKIAFEKAGIIKSKIPVVTAVDEPEALAVIEKIARENNAPLVKMISEFGIRNSELSLLGEHQKQNAALTRTTIEVLQKIIPVLEEQIRAGLQNVNWPGRLQLLEKPDGQKILLDGAHNVAGANVLREAIENSFSSEQRTFILGMLQDKDWKRICEILAPLAEKIFTVPVSSGRTASPIDLAEVCRAANSTAEIFICDSLKEAFEKTDACGHSSSHENFIIVTGSLYLVGEALELLGLSPTNKNERVLNEWAIK